MDIVASRSDAKRALCNGQLLEGTRKLAFARARAAASHRRSATASASKLVSGQGDVRVARAATRSAREHVLLDRSQVAQRASIDSRYCQIGVYHNPFPALGLCALFKSYVATPVPNDTCLLGWFELTSSSEGGRS